MTEGPNGVYKDRTGKDKKPDPMNMVFLEFPRAMMSIAEVTAFGATKHARRGWQTVPFEEAIPMFTGALGRHLVKTETEGPVNGEDGNLLHLAQVAWNALAALEHYLKAKERAISALEKEAGDQEVDDFEKGELSYLTKPPTGPKPTRC